MNIAQIRNLDVANGPGIRVSLFVSGCKHNCFNCFNKEYQNYNYGDEFTKYHQDKIQKLLSNQSIRGLSLLGGEPMDFPLELSNLIDNITFREDQDIWLWSGYTMEEILLSKDKIELLKRIDTLVDGKFVNSKKDLNLKFRGSSNQRIIDVQSSIKQNNIVLREGY